MRVRCPSAALVLLVCAAACGPGGGAPSAAPGSPASSLPATELQVYAAASLRKVLDRVASAYGAASAGVTLTVSADASSALEAKIEQGAPADVFLSADSANPTKLVDGGFTAGDVVRFAGNHLVVIVPSTNPAGITSPADLAGPGVKIVASADGVPIQEYTTQLLANLVADAGYPADFPAKVAANVVSREDNVGAIVAKIALGEGDAGIVYTTDARASDRVAAIAVPAGADVPASYGGVVVKTSRHPEAAAAFLAWLAGPDGQAVLASFGFAPAG